MKNLLIVSSPEVRKIFDNYPVKARNKMLALRNLVIETAKEINEIDKLEETLKWGEPSYITKIGSTLRMDWKPKSPDQYAMYFKCTSKLVETFKKKFKDLFQYENNRAIIFQMNDIVPRKELKRCIRAALMYHKVKHDKHLMMRELISNI